MLKTYPVVHPDAGVTRQVLSETPDLMVVSFRFETGAQGALHDHPHIQSTYVLSGKFQFSVSGKDFPVGPGDSFVIPSGTYHGCTCLEAGELIDTFSPRRDDFL